MTTDLKATRASEYQRLYADEVTVQGRGPEVVSLTFAILEQWQPSQAPVKLQLLTVYLPRATAAAMAEILGRVCLPETPDANAANRIN